MALVEICIDSVAGAKAAQHAGADRVELCSDLVEGGITPSYGLIKKVRECLTSTKLMVIIRPRGGDFVYNGDELQVMMHDIKACKELGAHGVVIGCLTVIGQIDVNKMSILVQAANQQELDITFHRAFDLCRDLSEALEELIRLGVPRVLTSGGRVSAQQGTRELAALVRQAAERISIMAGGSITSSNVAAILQDTGVHELHSSAKRRHHSPVLHRPAHMSLCAQAPLSDYEWHCTDQAEISNLIDAVTKKTKVVQH